jgi:hypothetical protein
LCAFDSPYKARELSELNLLQLIAGQNRRVCPSPNADSREGVEQSKYVEEPQHYANDDDSVQDRLDASGHGDETIHQPQQNADYDQG